MTPLLKFGVGVVAFGSIAVAAALAKDTEQPQPASDPRTTAPAIPVAFVSRSARLPRASDSPAELPRVFLDTRMPTLRGNTLRVPAGGDLQLAIDRARPGDEIVLAAGATYSGSFVLPEKSGDAWIVIRSEGTLPPEGTRVSPESATRFARLVGGLEPTLFAKPGARRYRITALEVTTSNRIDKGRRQIELAEGSSNIVIDRSYVHGHPDLAAARCILLNADSAAVVDSYVSECHTKGFDSQAISSYKSLGPLKIVNNFLSGAGETLYIGGSSPTTRGEGVTADIEIRGNHITKDPAWFASDRWTVKNLLELKFGKRVLIEGNLLEHNWTDGQDGDAVNIKDLTKYPSAVTEDITMRNNVIRYSDGGIQIANVSRITLENNLIEKLQYYKRGRTFSISSGVRSLILRHNTVRDVNDASLLQCTKSKNPDAVIEDNVFDLGKHGWKCAGAKEGKSSLDASWPRHVWRNNTLISDKAERSRSRYPAGTQVVARSSQALPGRGADLSLPSADPDAIPKAIGRR